MYRTHLPFRHKCDIYKRSDTIKPSGQILHDYNTSRVLNQASHYIPNFSRHRTTPTWSDDDIINLFLPFNATIEYTDRVQNIRDREGNVIMAGPFEVLAIIPQINATGKLSHIHCLLETITEAS